MLELTPGCQVVLVVALVVVFFALAAVTFAAYLIGA